MAQGVTGMCWGTDGLLQSPKPGSGYAGTGGFYVVEDFNEKELVDNIKLPGGTGPTLTRVQIVDGLQWAVTVRDDVNMSPPKTGTTVGIVDAGKILAATAKYYTATVVENDYKAAPKTPGQRVLVVENLINIESQVGAVQA